MLATSIGGGRKKKKLEACCPGSLASLEIRVRGSDRNAEIHADLLTMGGEGSDGMSRDCHSLKRDSWV